MKQEHQTELAAFLEKIGSAAEFKPTEEQVSRAEAVLNLARSPEFLKAIIDSDSQGRNLIEFRLFEGVPADKPSAKQAETIVFRVQFVRDSVNPKLTRYLGAVEGRMVIWQNFEGDQDTYRRKIIKDAEEVQDWFEASYGPDGWGVRNIKKTAHDTYDAFLSRSYLDAEVLAKRHGRSIEQIWKNLQTLLVKKDQKRPEVG